MMRRLFRFLGIAAAVLAGLTLLGVGFFGVVVLSREPLKSSVSTTHPSISRQACLDCHAPIAQEWRRSFHYQSLNGPYWRDVRDLGYLKIFDLTRKACVNCHAPANVLDLASSPSTDGKDLGVECTPNLLREPAGTIPAARSDQVELGVDCTSCHVSQRGVVGAGDHPTEAHATVADPRFQSAALASRGLCGTCHRATVEAWERTKFAREGITCLDCHMPETIGASVAGGPERRRRAHSFAGDKDPAMLERAVNASLTMTEDHRARFRIRNDRVGHFLPSGGNWLSVEFKVLDASGRMLSRRVEGFGKDEALILDFWPFNRDGRISSGEEKEVLLPLPAGHGTVEAVVRYHDWMKVKRIVATLKGVY